MNFQVSSKNQKAREAIYELFAPKNRGELVSHAEIEKASGLKRSDPKGRYHKIMEDVKKWHRATRGITLHSEVGVGYSLGTPDQQLNEMTRRTRRARRQVTRGIKDVESLPDDHATDHQRKLRDVKVAEGERLARETRDSTRLQDFLMRRKPGEPLRIRLRDDDQAEAV